MTVGEVAKLLAEMEPDAEILEICVDHGAIRMTTSEWTWPNEHDNSHEGNE